MKSMYTIRIPKPCHENWDEMTPTTQGKFCGSCAKNVVDFTTKSAAEIEHYLAKNTGQRICGRFESTQLSGIRLQIPQQLLLSQVPFRKMFLLALFVAMGTSLFSCSDLDGNKQKIENVEVVENGAAEEANITIGMLMPPDPDTAANFDTLPPPPPPPPEPKIEEIQFVKRTKMGKVKIIQPEPKNPAFSEKLTGEVVLIKDSLNHDEN